MVLDKANGGKADALNAGLNAARYPLVCCVDADGLLEPDAVRQMACLFARRENTVAVGGMVRPMNGCPARAGRINRIQLPRKPLELVQVVEYLRAFLTSRFGWESINSLLIVSGAFGMFDRAALLEAGGYDHTIGEDAELTLRLHRRMLDTGRPYTIAMALDAVCWTQVPADLRGLRTQRIRWQKGLADALWKHRALLLNPRYGRVGMLALPFFWFSELLGPLVELLGYLLLAAALLLGVAAPPGAGPVRHGLPARRGPKRAGGHGRGPHTPPVPRRQQPAPSVAGLFCRAPGLPPPDRLVALPGPADSVAETCLGDHTAYRVLSPGNFAGGGFSLFNTPKIPRQKRMLYTRSGRQPRRCPTGTAALRGTRPTPRRPPRTPANATQCGSTAADTQEVQNVLHQWKL